MNSERNMQPKDVESRTDHSLLRRFRAGEEDAATRLYLRYAARLQALASSQTSPQMATRFDAEDVVQSVFRTFFRRAQKGLYDVPPGDELWQLLLVLALNKIRGLAVHHRAQKCDVKRTVGGTELAEVAQGMGGDEIAYSALQMVIESVLGEIPEVQRRMIELRIDGHRVEDIATLTERSKRTVERVLQGVRERLSGLIDGQSN
ncbi:MAG: ECF-type sigma factor [Planctomycetota bacterium]|nr:ECF-type sigma factor [Planctomycetota bacterium]MDA1177772.1 ECF-type sigma factor [Planctomycetota bacterium]